MGSFVFNVLWSCVKDLVTCYHYDRLNQYTTAALVQLTFLGSAKVGLVQNSVQVHRKDALRRNRTR
jgi:hypothetical protein